MNEIIFDKVSKNYYKENLIFGKTLSFRLHECSFSIKEGESFSLIGESGSGKTTLAKLLSGMEQKSGGEIIMKGFKKSDIKYIFQNPHSSLNPRMSIYDILIEPLNLFTNLSKSEKDDRISNVIAKLMLSKINLKESQKNLSGGEKQRVALARALLSGAKVLILDEPVSGLDVMIAAHLMHLFKKIQKEENLSYLFISHDIALSQFLSDEIAVMKDGIMLEKGKTEEVINNPKNEYTKMLINASSYGFGD